MYLSLKRHLEQVPKKFLLEIALKLNRAQRIKYSFNGGKATKVVRLEENRHKTVQLTFPRANICSAAYT